MTARVVTAHLMTRGTPRRLDYRFLDPGPGQHWWAPLSEWVVLEQPEVLVRGGPTPGVLVSGIPSTRRDVVGTAIRFTLVVDGAPPELLCGLAAAGLAPAGRADLGTALDAAFPAAWVDAALDGHPPDDDEVATRLAPALAALSPAPRTAGPDDQRSWVGALRDEQAVEAFLDRVQRLASGAPGWALTTAALTTVDGAREAAVAVGGMVGILIADGGPAEVVALGPAPGKAPAGRPAGLSPSHRRPVTTAVLVTVLVLTMVTVLAIVLL